MGVGARGSGSAGYACVIGNSSGSGAFAARAAAARFIASRVPAMLANATPATVPMKIRSILLLSPPEGCAAGVVPDTGGPNVPIAGNSVCFGGTIGRRGGLLIGCFTGFAGAGGVVEVLGVDDRGVVLRRAGRDARGVEAFGVVVLAGGVAAGGTSGVTGGASGAGAAAKATPGIRAIASAHSKTAKRVRAHRDVHDLPGSFWRLRLPTGVHRMLGPSIGCSAWARASASARS